MLHTCRIRRTTATDPRNRSSTGNPRLYDFVRILRNCPRHPLPRNRGPCIPHPRAKSLCFVETNMIEILMQVELESCYLIYFI